MRPDGGQLCPRMMRVQNMAATIARATGSDSSRVKTVHRLGSQYSAVEAATWRTFARASEAE